MQPLVEELIQQWDLLDFKTKKGFYTWTNNRLGTEHISTRLDIFLLENMLLLEKKLISPKILPWFSSDHKPILLQLEEEENLGPIPSRFNPLWIEKDDFMETIMSAWSSPISRSPSYVWEQKLKATKIALKDWIKNLNNTPSCHIKETIQQLLDLQMEMERGDINTIDLEREQAAQHTSFWSFRNEQEYWRLKSRSLWLKVGDINTSYFHRQFRSRLSRNHISEIVSLEGTVFKGYEQIKGATKIHFQKLFRDDGIGSEEVTSDFLSHIPCLVSREDNQCLLNPYA